jgi:aldose 1-epimerase
LEAIELHCGESTVRLFPQHGAAVGNWQWRGLSLLHAPDGQAACFPMLPYANRIAHGRLPGEAVLPPHPGEAHSLHGIGWQRGWRVIEQHAAHVVLGLQHGADRDWPFDFTATLSIALGENWLTHTLWVTNTGQRSMPLGLGFHPFFPAGAGTRLSADWSGRWDVSPDHLPVGLAPEPVAPGPVDVGPWRVNNCYTGWNGKAVLSYPDHALLLSADPLCRFLQCYRPGTESAFVAIEPVTHIPNAHQLRAAGVPDTGLCDLAPGAVMSTWMTLLVV